jgi:hypothetical protein
MSATIDITAPTECDWPITNCYIDAWTLILNDWELDPVAGLGVTVAQDYEGDQFTFFKYMHDDLERLYGIVVGELTIYASLEEQIEEQVRRGHLVLAEADGWYLPDTRATSYRTQHTKTTIGIDSIDVAAGELGYFHNVGHYRLTGEDYAGVFRKLPHQASDDALPPYVEFAICAGGPSATRSNAIARTSSGTWTGCSRGRRRSTTMHSASSASWARTTSCSRATSIGWERAACRG